MAGWRPGASVSATFDHGAQFFTVRGDAFGGAGCGVGGRRGRAGVVSRLHTRRRRVPAVHRDAWDERDRQAHGRRSRRAVSRDGVRDPPRRPGGRTDGKSSSTTARSIAPDAVVSTCPLAQTFSLLFEAGVDFPRELVADDYDRTIALLAVLDGAERRASTRRRPARRGDLLVRGRQRGQGHQRRSGPHVARRAGLERTALGP